MHKEDFSDFLNDFLIIEVFPIQLFPACNLHWKLIFNRNRCNERVLVGFLIRIPQFCQLAEANILILYTATVKDDSSEGLENK